jgi:hypothetical protein
MSLRVARDIVMQQDFDSAALTPLCSLIHFIEQPGLYIGEVVHGDNVVGSFRVQAVGDGAARQANIDLALVRGMQEPVHLVLAGGALVFHSSSGTIGYAVKLWRAGEKRRTVEFDSRKLGADDLFGVTLLYPGNWEVTDEKDRPLCGLTVKACKRSKKPYRAPAAAMMGLGKESLEGEEPASLKQVQTQVFKAEGRARIKVRLAQADRVAASAAPAKVQWRP